MMHWFNFIHAFPTKTFYYINVYNCWRKYLRFQIIPLLLFDCWINQYDIQLCAKFFFLYSRPTTAFLQCSMAYDEYTRIKTHTLKQRFSTCGPRTPWGPCRVLRGSTSNCQKYTKYERLGWNSTVSVCQSIYIYTEEK